MNIRNLGVMALMEFADKNATKWNVGKELARHYWSVTSKNRDGSYGTTSGYADSYIQALRKIADAIRRRKGE